MLASSEPGGVDTVSEDEAFKVTDRRRRFDEDAEAPPPPVASDSPPATRASAPPPMPEREPSQEPGGPDLQGVFMMFASSALLGLGEPDPMTGEQRLDLDQAQDAVETLLLLREKTEGNRTEVETRLLDDILYDLQMRFDRLTEGGATGLR